MKNPITVETLVQGTPQQAWDVFTKPEHITQWNNASEDWHTTAATNDLVVGGRFDSRMEAKDGSAGFNFTGTYDEVVPLEKIAYTMDDGRKAQVLFAEEGTGTRVTTAFEPEAENPVEMQKAGWQAILDSYTEYAEKNS